MGSGKLLEGALIVLVCQDGEENVHHIQLGHPGGHGAAAKQRFVGGGIEPEIGQIGHRRLDASGNGNDGRAAALQIFHARDDLRCHAGVGKYQRHILGGGVAGLHKLGMPVLVDNTQLV